MKKSNPKPIHYHPDDIPKPLDVEICPLCNWSTCRCKYDYEHPEGEE